MQLILGTLRQTELMKNNWDRKKKFKYKNSKARKTEIKEEMEWKVLHISLDFSSLKKGCFFLFPVLFE